MESSSRLAREQVIDTVYLSVPLTTRSPEQFAELRDLAPEYPEVREVGIDDFVAAYERLGRDISDHSEVLERAIGQLKADASKLQFGITVYEHELDQGRLDDDEISPRVRAMVDNVHLYLLYRRAASRFGKYVKDVKRLFPNARVIAGSYAYDRIDYLPCKSRSTKPCSTREEVELFSNVLDEQIALLKNGDVYAIEFYPAYFGKEAEWHGWQRERICKPGSRERCIDTTLQMRRVVQQEIAELRGGEGTQQNR